MPVSRRSTAGAETSLSATGFAAGRRRAPGPPGRRGLASGFGASTSVFHSPQPAHWPAQRRDSCPHELQK